MLTKNVHITKMFTFARVLVDLNFKTLKLNNTNTNMIHVLSKKKNSLGKGGVVRIITTEIMLNGD